MLTHFTHTHTHAHTHTHTHTIHTYAQNVPILNNHKGENDIGLYNKNIAMTSIMKTLQANFYEFDKFVNKWLRQSFLNRDRVELDLIDSSNLFQSFIPTYDNEFIDDVNLTLGKWKKCFWRVEYEWQFEFKTNILQYFSGSNFELTENMNIKVFKVTRSYIGRMDSCLKRGVLAE